MTQITLKSPALDQARANLDALISALHEHADLAPSVIIKAAGADPKFLQNYKTRDFQFGTYDRVTSRLAAVWPGDIAWPRGIARPEPAEIEPETRKMVEGALDRARKRALRREKADG